MFALVTGNTGQSCMFAGSFCQLGHNCTVTRVADISRRFFRNHDASWLMNRMALEALCHCLSGKMRLGVAGETGWFEAV
jgi:hypothetical protein